MRPVYFSLDNPLFGTILHRAAQELYERVRGEQHPGTALRALAASGAVERVVADAVGAECLSAGDWAVAYAYEGLGATFKGWYAEGRNPKVAKPDCTSRAYRMRVADDRALVAVFG